MSVTVCLPLYGNPGRELDGKVRPRDLRALGDALKLRLERAALTLALLEASGWSARSGEYDLMLSHPGARTQDDAEQLLGIAGVDVGEFIVFEEVEDDE